MLSTLLSEGGEELFGLTVTEYPNLQRIRKELGLLQKLYNLYNSVIDNVNGYYDILWQEIDIEKINNELMEYQNRYARFISWLLSTSQNKPALKQMNR